MAKEIKITTVPITDNNAVKYNLAGHDVDFTGLKRSYLGTPVFDPLQLIVDGVLIEFDSVLMSVSMENNIERTFIQGRTGSVKEYVNAGDYTIEIEGGLYAKGVYEFPETELKNMLTVLKNTAQKIECISEFLQHFGIYEVVVNNFKFNQQQGSRNTLPFSISLWSDAPFEFLINGND